MKEKRYGIRFYVTLWSICPFLFIGIVFGILPGCSEKSEQTKVSHESVKEKKNRPELPKIDENTTAGTLPDSDEKSLDVGPKPVGPGIREGIAFPDIIDMNNKAYAKHTRGILTFTHRKHAKEYAEKYPELYKDGCGSCHHDTENKPLRHLKEGDDVQNCLECHKKAGYVQGKEAKGLSKEEKREYHANAIHDNCKGCHRDFNKKMKLKSKDKGAAPVTCKTCHGEADK